MSHVLLYVTTASAQEAETIGRALVEQRLAACVNIIPAVRSLYWWQGNICCEGEAVFVAKTEQRLVEAVTQEIKKRHSYTVPAILVLPIEGGNAEFLDWVSRELR